MQNTSNQPSPFNTHSVVKKLIAKGFIESQAEEIVDAILEGRNSDLSQLATKEQLIEVQKNIALLKKDFESMKHEIAAKATKGQVSELKSEMGINNEKIMTEIEKIRTEIEKAKLSAILIIGSLIVASTTVIGVLIKYFSIH